MEGRLKERPSLRAHGRLAQINVVGGASLVIGETGNQVPEFTEGPLRGYGEVGTRNLDALAERVLVKGVASNQRRALVGEAVVREC